MKKVAKLVAISAAVILFLFSMIEAEQSVSRLALASSQTGSVDAAALYAKNCAKCHGKDGRAKSFRGKLVGARDFTNADWQSRVTDETLANSIANGRGSMPSFKKKLPADQIKSLVAYVRQFKK